MRISTQMLFERGTSRMLEVQTSLAKTQAQLSTGRRILSPSDDPVAAARALEVTQSKSINSQYATNRTYAKNALGAVEGILGSVTELLQGVRETFITATNGTLSDSDRNILATNLSSRFDQLLGLANSKDALGNYMFSGYQTNTAAFTKTATGATYQGDAGQQLLQVDSTRQIAVNSTGQSVFQGSGQDIFQTLNDFITLMQTPGVPASATLTTHLGNLDLALDNVLTVRAMTGTRLQEIDALDNFGADRDVQYSQILSELQDLDYTQALTQLTQQQVTLEAAQRSFVKVSGLSLFNFL